MKKYILLLLLVSFTTLKPIKEKNAKWIGLGTGVVASGLYARSILKSIFSNPGGGIVLVVGAPAILGGILASGTFSGLLAYQIAKYHTPDSKLERARKILNTCFNNNSNPENISEKSLIKLLKARHLLKTAVTETEGERKYMYLRKDAKEMNEALDKILK